jgi:hypothetical protein
MTVQDVIEGPLRCRVTDHDDARPTPTLLYEREESANLLSDLLVALNTWEGGANVLQADQLQLLDGHAREIAVVALAQPPILVDRDAGLPERDPGGLDGPGEVGGEQATGGWTR